MNIIESVKNFILTCPFLSELAAVNIDFLPDSTDTYSIEEVPAQSVLQTYLDGSQERQYVFVFASRFYYSDETKNNIENSGFYENFSDWLDEQTQRGNLPIMRDGLTPTKVEALSSGYLFDVAGDLSNARYQIQCQLIYDKE